MSSFNLDNDDSLTPEERIKLENELNKLKLQAEYGADFHSEGNLPPEIENDFLKHVMQFEEQFKNRVTIKLYDFIGKPDFKTEEDLSDKELSVELERLITILDDNQIAMDTICDYEERVIYKFLTTELFNHEMDDMHMPDMVTHYTYEEFHPNHDYDIRNTADDFFGFLMNRSLEFIEIVAPFELLASSGETLVKEQVHKRISDFINAYTDFSNPQFEITQSQFNLETAIATVNFNCSYQAKVDTQKAEIISGKGVFGFIYQYDYWYMNSVNMPGFIV